MSFFFLCAVACSARFDFVSNAIPTTRDGRVIFQPPKLTMKNVRQQLRTGLTALYKQYDRFVSMFVELEEHSRQARDTEEELGLELWGIVDRNQHNHINPERPDHQMLNETQVISQQLFVGLAKAKAQQATLGEYADIVESNLKEAELQLRQGVGLACHTLKSYIAQQGIRVSKFEHDQAALAVLSGNGAVYDIDRSGPEIQFVPMHPQIRDMATRNGPLGWRCFEQPVETDDALVSTLDGFRAVGYTVLRRNHALKLRKLMEDATPWPRETSPADSETRLKALEAPHRNDRFDTNEDAELVIHLASYDGPIASLMP